MIEQVGNAITFYAFYVESKLGKTGLTVTVDVWERTSSTSTEVVAGASATELGDGCYFYQLASGTVDAEAEYFACFKTSTTTVDAQHIPALWVVGKAGVENLNASVSSRSSHTAADVWAAATRTLTSFGSLVAEVSAALAGTIVTVTGPVIASDEIELVPGDAYDSDHSRALAFALTGAPTLVGVSASYPKLVIDGAFEVSGTVATPGASTQTLTFEITAAQSVLLTRKGTAAYRYQIQAQWTADTPAQPAVLARGNVNTIERAAV